MSVSVHVSQKHDLPRLLGVSWWCYSATCLLVSKGSPLDTKHMKPTVNPLGTFRSTWCLAQLAAVLCDKCASRTVWLLAYSKFILHLLKAWM